jgi:hypothetical protein
MTCAASACRADRAGMRALDTAQDQLVQSEQAVAGNLIALYMALGGGWESSVPTPDAVTRHGR